MVLLMACIFIISDRDAFCDYAALIERMSHTRVKILRSATEISANAFCQCNRTLLLIDLCASMRLIEILKKVSPQGGRTTVVLAGETSARTAYASSSLARHHGLDVLRCITHPIQEEDLLSALVDWDSRPAFRDPPHRKSYSEQEIRAAIEKAELVNYYQPKLSLPGGAIEGVELLLRWAHPADGLVLPGQFIGTAESSALIDELTLGALEAALDDLKRWHANDVHPTLAINLSMESLHRPAFVDRLHTLLSGPRAAPCSITLEVTESRIMQDPVSVLSALSRLRADNIILSIDDFGTGHASLAQLRDIPFEEIKIDRGFISDVHRNPIHQAIYQGILSMAKGMQIRTVAEGVESQGELAYLKDTGCDYAQGYLIARPMNAGDIISFAKSRINGVYNVS